jgi:hypothetical protein
MRWVVSEDPKAITRDVACYLSALSVSYGVMLAARESPQMIEEERERARRIPLLFWRCSGERTEALVAEGVRQLSFC